ncbi:MAG: acyltransferase [Bacteroidaceae bacterium]|nr:acyltransferase [Bacteroidaceae bacterium]
MQKNTISSAVFADTKSHYELLDGLRGVAAILVVFYHIFEGLAFAEATNGAGGGLITTLNHGHIAVDFFFILSGFVISYAYDDRWGKMGTWQFFKRRLVRLHPMLVMGALIGVLAFAFVGFEKWDGTSAPMGWVMVAMLLTMFMIPALPGVPYEVRGNGEMFPLNGPAWSLFFEYVGNILYALVIRRLSTKVLALLAVVLGCLHACFFVGNVSGYDMVGVGWTINEVNFWGGLVRMLFPFTVGMLLARTFRPRRVKGAFWICSLALVILFAVPYIAPMKNVDISINSLYEVVCIAFVFPLIVWLGACGNAKGGLAHKINKTLGDLSYPLYIVHYPVMYVFYAWLIEKKYYTLQECLGVALLVVLLSIVLALLCLKLYDEPVRRWLTRKMQKK